MREWTDSALFFFFVETYLSYCSPTHSCPEMIGIRLSCCSKSAIKTDDSEFMDSHETARFKSVSLEFIDVVDPVADVFVIDWRLDVRLNGDGVGVWFLLFCCANCSKYVSESVLCKCPCPFPLINGFTTIFSCWWSSFIGIDCTKLQLSMPTSENLRMWNCCCCPCWICCSLFVCSIVEETSFNWNIDSLVVGTVSIFLSLPLPLIGNEKNVFSSFRRCDENGFFSVHFSLRVCWNRSRFFSISITTSFSFPPCSMAVRLSMVSFELLSSDIDMDPFKNGFVHDRGPFVIFATASDKLIRATPQLAGLECWRFVIGRGITLLLLFTSFKLFWA